MVEVTLSMVNRGKEYNELLLSLLHQFEQQTHIHINLVNADVKRSDLKSYAIYQRGPDVSEIATTWVSDMISMNALRTFSDRELARIGQQSDFAPGAWQTCQQLLDTNTWAIPFLMEAVVIHYRGDLLEKAGVDEQQAFLSLEAVRRTAEKLAEVNIPIPVELPYWSLFDQLHALSGWLWSANAEYVTSDGKKVLFSQPQALETMCQYFGLIRHYSLEGIGLALESKGSLFRQGQAAVTFSAHMLKDNITGLPSEVQEHWRVASYPGEKYVGGSNLAIWKYARNEEAALELIRFLSSLDVQMALVEPSLQLPSRLIGLSSPRVQQNHLLSVASQSAMTGRSYPAVPMWGLIEENLINGLHAIQLNLLKSASAGNVSDALVEQTVRDSIEHLARKMNTILAR